MAEKRARKLKNGSKLSIGNSSSLVSSEVNVNSVNRTFLPEDTVMRSVNIDDDWWEDVPVPGYASKSRLLRKLQQDEIYDNTRIITSPFVNWWSHLDGRNLPDCLPRELNISVNSTLPDVTNTPEIQHVERKIHQERFDSMWNEDGEDSSTNPRSIKNTSGPVSKSLQSSLESSTTYKTRNRELHKLVSRNLSDEVSLHSSNDFTIKIGKQKGSKLIRKKDNYRKLALLNKVKQFELMDQNESFESSEGHSSESETVKRRKNQLSKLISSENNNISLPERVRKTVRVDNASKDGSLVLTNKDLHLPKNANNIPTDLSGVTDIKERLTLSLSSTQRRARKIQEILNLSWSGHTDLNNSDMQQRRNIRSPFEASNPRTKNALEINETAKTASKYLEGFLCVPSEDELSKVSYKQHGNKELSKLNKQLKNTRHQFLSIEDKNEISSEKLQTQLSLRDQKYFTKMSSISDTTSSELALHNPTSHHINSSLRSTKDTSAEKVPTVSKVKSKFLQNLFQDNSSISSGDSLIAESSTLNEKVPARSRAPRTAKRGLIADKLLAFSDVSENSQEIENENSLDEMEATLKSSRRDSSAIRNVNAITDLSSKQSTALRLREESKTSLETGQSSGDKNLHELPSKKYETEIPNLQSNTSLLKEITENSNGSSILETKRRAECNGLEPNNSRRDLSTSEKGSAQKGIKDSTVHIITDSPSKQTSLRDLSKHSVSKEISSNAQHKREITYMEVSKSESNVNNDSGEFHETDKKQMNIDTSTRSDQEASKSWMGADHMPKHRSQRISEQQSKNDNDASKLLSDQKSHWSNDENLNDFSVSATRKVENGEVILKDSRRDLSASEKVSAQERSKDSRLPIVPDLPSKQSTKQISLGDLSRLDKSKEISSNVQLEREITQKGSKSESKIYNESRVFLETDNKNRTHFESSTLSLQEANESFFGAGQTPKHSSLRISSDHTRTNDNVVSNLLSDKSLLQRVGTNSVDGRIPMSERKTDLGVVVQNSRKDLFAPGKGNAEGTSMCIINSADKQLTTLQRCLRDLSRSGTLANLSASENYERENTHDGNVSKLRNQNSVLLETTLQEQSRVSNIHSRNKEETTSLLEITQTSNPKGRFKSLDSVNDKFSPVIAHGVNRRMMKRKGLERNGIADRSKSESVTSITQPKIMLGSTQQNDSRVKINSSVMSHSSRDIVQSPKITSINKSELQRLHRNSQMESVFKAHTSISNKDKYQKGISIENVKNTNSSSALLKTKTVTLQGVTTQKHAQVESLRNTALARLHHKRLQEKLRLFQYQKACSQMELHSANNGTLRKLLAHRKKLANIFNNNDILLNKYNGLSNIGSQEKDIVMNEAKRAEKVASIMKYVQSTKSPRRDPWGNADGHSKVAAAEGNTKTSLNRKQRTCNPDVKIVRIVNKTPRIKRPTWLHARLYKSLTKAVIMKIKNKNVINPQKNAQEIITKLVSLVEKVLHYRRKGRNPFVDEVIKYLYHSDIIKTPMNFICFCMKYLPETFIDKALRVKENDSGILGNVIDRDLNL